MNQLSKWLKPEQIENLGQNAMEIVTILIAAGISWLILRFLISRFAKHIQNQHDQGRTSGEKLKRAETLTNLLRTGAKISILILTLLMILTQVGVEIAPLLAGAGIAGLAVGFGAQSLVKDVITGFFILLEDQIRVGDIAVINGTGGLVEKINFRTIVLRDLSGVVHIFPNGNISTLSNMTKEWSGYILDIGVAYKEDTDRCVEIMKEVSHSLKEDSDFSRYLLEDINIFGVDQFADSSVVIKARLKTSPGEQWKLGREYKRRLKKAFDEKGIEIPFPHVSLYAGEASKPFPVKNNLKD